MNIRIKVPSMAQFVPSSIFTMNGVVWPFYQTFGNCHPVGKFGNVWIFPHYTLSIYTDLNHCFENRFIPVDDFQNWDDPFYTNAWFRDTPEFLLDTTEHTFKSVVMSLRDYYIKHVDEYLHKYTFGYDENLILIQWMEHPASGFQQFIKRSDWIYNPFIYDLDHLITGFVRSNRYKITRQIDEDIKITVSPCH